MKTIKWHGGIDNYFDEIHLEEICGVTIGCYGGLQKMDKSSNEDGLYVIAKENNYVLSIIMDAHTTNESVRHIINVVNEREDILKDKLGLNLKDAMKEVSNFFVDLIHDKTFIEDSRKISGETAFLVVFQKDNYLWWLSVGDLSLYLFHKEFSELGQYKLNERVFYQWIGEKNSIGLEIPCFTQGTIELRRGRNRIVMLTDGVLEIPGRPFEDPSKLYALHEEYNNNVAAEKVLEEVKKKSGCDSATIISWGVDNDIDGLRPTNTKEHSIKRQCK